MQAREKIAKFRNTSKHYVFQWFVAPEGRKVGSLKRWARSRLGRWEMTNCTPLWREAHFEVKSVKNLWRFRCVKSAHRCGAKQKVKNTTWSDHFWRFGCGKSAHRCAKSTFQNQNGENTTRSSSYYYYFSSYYYYSSYYYFSYYYYSYCYCFYYYYSYSYSHSYSTTTTTTTTATTTTTTTATTTTTTLPRQLQQHQPQLQYNYNYTTIQLQLLLQLHCATLHHTTSSTCNWGDHCNHLKNHNSNHLSVHQWIRSAIHASQQLTSPIVSYLWNFRHRLVRYYCYTY